MQSMAPASRARSIEDQHDGVNRSRPDHPEGKLLTDDHRCSKRSCSDHESQGTSDYRKHHRCASACNGLEEDGNNRTVFASDGNQRKDSS
jgi:hypothetical protein